MGLGITIDQLFYGAYREAGLVELEQTQLSPDQTEEARQVFNKYVDALQLDGNTISHVARLLFDIVPNQGDYTLGPGGDWDPGAGVATAGPAGQIASNYPVRLERASVVLTSLPGASGPPEHPLRMLTIDEWQEWRLKQQSTNWPWCAYYEPAYSQASPLAIVHLLYVPTDSNQVALYLEETIAQIEATGDALLDFRPGYQDMIESNLARRIGSRTPGWQEPSHLAELVRSSTNLVKMANHRPLKRDNDMSRRGGRSNVYAGNRYGQR